MRHSHFEIKNFKGIAQVRIDLDTAPRGNIYTLVGLNESGKTTILEALNFLSYRTETLDPLNLPGYSVKDVHELIPISRRANFTDSIVLTAGYIPNADDNQLIRDYLRKELGFELAQDVPPFEVTQTYAFVDSQLVSSSPPQPRSTWSIKFIGKRPRAKKQVELDGEDWQKAIVYVRKLLPSILYFPNFLFEFPDKIYLEDLPTNAESSVFHRFYRTILQDVLDSIGGNMNLQKHVLDRAKAGGPFDQRALESVLLKMGSDITAKVFKAWNRIFNRSVGNKEIVVGWDEDAVGGWYLQLRLKDADELYTISERSLGFRWFFAFLMLTQYRGFRKDATKNVLFLLDEPASNLHPSAQTQLLESFGRFPGNCSIVYTTHSHHMINPDWLEGTLVVKNEGLDYDAEEEDYNARKTLVTAQKYRDFAAHHPNQTTYFQPVLDVLNYSPGRLENVPDVVMVEGKNDFYTLKFFLEKVLTANTALHLLPGGGAGSLDDVIRLYLAWGRNFIILLDSDDEGVLQKRRYEERFGALVRDRIYSLQDVEGGWKKTGMERLVSESDRMSIQSAVYPQAKTFKKAHFNRAVQELYLTDQHPLVSETTLGNFEKIISFCQAKLINVV